MEYKRRKTQTASVNMAPTKATKMADAMVIAPCGMSSSIIEISIYNLLSYSPCKRRPAPPTRRHLQLHLGQIAEVAKAKIGEAHLLLSPQFLFFELPPGEEYAGAENSQRRFIPFFPRLFSPF